MKSLRESWQALIIRGEIEKDAAQDEALAKMEALRQKIDETRGWRRFFRRLGKGEKARQNGFLGVYLWGGVGRGKTMIMDMFCKSVPSSWIRRVHFHEFMQDIHARLHERHQREERDPLPSIAAQIASQSPILALDEFFVDDIVDAEILGRLFTELFAQNVFCVATSNIPPQNLYENGLNRYRFLPFIDLLQKKMAIVPLRGARDYRLAHLEGERIYYAGLPKEEARRAMDALFEKLSCGRDAKETLYVHGRALPVPLHSMGTARFSFGALCEKPLGAADYLALAQRFHTILMDGIPLFPSERRTEARRFITLIDILYDHGVKFAASADKEPEDLYVSGPDKARFARTASRLREMRGRDYLAAARKPARSLPEEKHLSGNI